MESLDDKIKEIKNNIPEAKLSKEFKDNLKIAMDKAYYEDDNFAVSLIHKKTKKRKMDFLFPKKIAAIFACVVIISSCAFAGCIGNCFSKLFSNMDPKMSFAIEDGYIQNIDMDYVESNDIKIKVDYLLFDEQTLYLAFNINTKKEFDDIYLNDFVIKDENDNIIFDTNADNDNIIFKTENKPIEQKSIMVLNKIENLDQNFQFTKKIKIELKGIEVFSNNNNQMIKGIWNMVIQNNFHEFSNNNVKNFFVDTPSIIKNYNIKLKNDIMQVQLEFDTNLNIDFDFKKNNIYLEDKNNNKYYVSNDFSISESNIVKFYIDVPKTIELKDMKLNLKYYKNQTESIVLYLNDVNG